MEKNCRLNINVEGYITNRFCLFRYFKILFTYYSFITYKYSSSVLLSDGKKACPFTQRDVNFADGIVFR